jgi:CheY-like chemotaxis protein
MLEHSLEQGLSDSSASDDLAEMPDFSGFTVLLAEDVEINREILITLLEDSGITIDVAENGIEAVQKFKNNAESYHMIIMDIHMPFMDGYQATESIRGLDFEKAKTIPIIALTADVFKEDIKKCIDSGMNGHLKKPIEIVKVIEMLSLYYKEEYKI